ncbi:serine hydrolase [Thalassobellus citreus]|uniref:serine hydrolase domain-containing protein n=1 Tax=Thalassobellus citreus TaxID=3367752 RepID=UPI0037B455E1
MIRKNIFAIIFLIPLYIIAQNNSADIKQFIDSVDEKTPQLLRGFNVPGAVIGIIENGEIILQKGYGYSNVDKEIKVTTKTGFNIGSISKTVTAWGIMKLVQEGKIELDAPAEKYLTRWHLPKSGFDSNEVTIRRLLSHTAGLSLHGYPGWSPNDILPTIEESLNGKNNGPGRVKIIMEPGTKWKYSGGGFTILQLIIEEVTGEKFEDYMQTEILNPLGMINSSYTIDEKILNSSSLEYNDFGEEIDFELFTAKAAAGLHTTLEDFMLFVQASLYKSENNKSYQHILSTDYVEQMMSPEPETNGVYGLGYQVEILGDSKVLKGHGGANSGWHALFMVDPISNDGFIMFTNGGAGYNIYSQIICYWEHWKSSKKVDDADCNKLPSISNKIKQIIDVDGTNYINNDYFELKKNQLDKYNFSEEQLNKLGYYYLGKGAIENSIAVFKLNVEAFPESYNVYDSYAEALLKGNYRDKAIENYIKSVELNSDNYNAIEILKKLGVKKH